MNDINSAAPESITVPVKSMAAKYRAERAYRDEVIAALGWTPEQTGVDSYAATTGEMLAWLTEKERAEGRPLTARKIFTAPHPLLG